jgi:hypothetical protein
MKPSTVPSSFLQQNRVRNYTFNIETFISKNKTGLICLKFYADVMPQSRKLGA